MKKEKNKELQKAGNKETSIVRSSAAEYLIFVAATGEGGVEAVYADENIWLQGIFEWALDKYSPWHYFTLRVKLK
jgi:hypothetical protein